MTVLEPTAARRRGLVVIVVVSLVAGIGLGVGLVAGVLTALPRTAARVGPPLDLHQVDWSDATLPGSVCGSPIPIRLRAGEATAVPSTFEGPTPNYPQDVHVDAAAVVYGDLTGDGRDEAAVPLGCNNHDSTAAGTTVSTVLLFDGSTGAAALLATVPSSQPRRGEIPNAVTVRQLLRARVVGEESFYSSSDANCCPSGHASTTWPWSGSELGSPEVSVTQPAAGTPSDTTSDGSAASSRTIDPAPTSRQPR